jgi:hypothetical protein
VVGPSPVLVIAALAAVGLGAWLLIVRRRRGPAREALTSWTQATCPVCLALGDAVRWEGAA